VGARAIAEVYTLNTLLILVIFWLVLRGGARRELTRQPARVSYRKLYTAALAFDLLGVHHVPSIDVARVGGLGTFNGRRRLFPSKRLLYDNVFVGGSQYLCLPAACRIALALNELG
jgi:hypothetical protein